MGVGYTFQEKFKPQQAPEIIAMIIFRAKLSSAITCKKPYRRNRSRAATN